MDKSKTCKNCKHHKNIRKDEEKHADWICSNKDSHNCGDRTLASERCPDFEARADK